MKLTKTFWKTFFMAIVGFVVMTLKEAGTFNLAYIALTTGFFAIGYMLKNWLYPSLSDKGKLELRDLISGLWIAVNMAAADVISQILIVGTIDWKALGYSVLGAALGYFGKTLPQGKK
jgi:EamA domain-containing membrane protein RarD